MSALRGWRAAAADEDGSTMVLYPFGVLIVLGLAGLALDFALYFQAHRESVDMASALANDMAAIVDEGAFNDSGSTRIDIERAQAVLDLTNGDLSGHPHGLRCSASIGAGAPDVVDVTCNGSVDGILLLGNSTVAGTATATAED